MKRFFVLLLSLTLLALSSCSPRSHEAEYEKQAKYFSEGQKDAVIRIQDIAESQYETYVKTEELIAILRVNYGSTADDIIDEIVFHPDLESYSAKQIVDEIIDQCVWEFE